MFEGVAWHTLVSAVACVGHLAFALVLWLRRDRGNLALPLSLLFLDTFLWTFAELAFLLTGAVEWHWVDHGFSSWLPVLTVQVIAAFVGRTRQLRPTLRVLYGAAALVAATSATELWWRLLLAYGVGCMVFCSVLLLQHRRRTTDATERGRTGALLLAVLFGTVLSSSDLWVDHFPGVPRLSDVGMLVILTLIAACVLRLRLLGRDVPGLLLVYALLGGTLLLAAGLVLVQSLPSRGAILALLLLSALAVGLAGAREAARARAANAERLQKLVALGRFSEQLAHDLKNPLAALKGAVQFLLVEREQGRSLDEQGHFLSLMLEQVERTSRVVEAYQRIANVEPIKVSTSLNELVQGVLGMQRFASTPDIDVRTRLQPGLPACELDAELLQTTLENLLRNAFDAMPAGGAITVETSAEPGRQGAPGVLLSVSDEGQGMDARILEHATEQFFTTKATGSGLGLNFVERVARAHHGYLDLSSELGRGTTVRLYLPRSASSISTVGLPAVSVPVDGAGRRVLVVEDDAAVRGVVSEMLIRAGYQTIAASDGPSARRLLAGHRDIELLLVDMMLPGGMSGAELVSAVRRENSALPVLFMTGYSNDALSESPEIHGIPLLAKPFTESALTAAVRDALGDTPAPTRTA